jgi:rhamnose utilization protein RhaD (predicted bifunctional aldolase and dehydrogenase)
MTIASQYAVLSKDRKTLVFPDDVQDWLRDVDRFVVVIENDGLILKKAHARRTLEEMVTKFEETKSWLRKLIRRKVLSESNATEYEAIVEKLGPKLNAFINNTKA